MNDAPGDERVPAPRLADLTTMRVGGSAERLLVARSRDELVELTRQLWDAGEPWLLLGGGSNTIVSDEGFPGTVLLIRNSGVDRVMDAAEPGRVRLRVQAGQDWDSLVAYCVKQGWAGIEALSGIPGLTGAAPVQNIGAYGAELSDVLHSIEFFDAVQGEVTRLNAEELGLGYRDSAMKQGLEGVVLSIDLVLETHGSADGDPVSAPVRYAQLADLLGVDICDRVPLMNMREAVLRLREAKGMVLRDEDHDTWSAGSFFTNPIVTERFARSLPTDAPQYPVDEDEPSFAVTPLEELQAGAPLRLPGSAPAPRVKLSAAWLIEQSGIEKGFRLPGSGAAISSKHSLAITNRGAATAADVAQLARLIVQRVQQEFGVILVPEPNLYGLEL